MPLQHVPSLRHSYPTLHKLSGYFVVSLSTLLALTGILFPTYNLSHSHPNIFHVHTWTVGAPSHNFPLLAWPTFALLSHLLGLVVLFLAAQTLLSGLYYHRGAHTHRAWTTALTYWSYAIPVQRVWLGVSQGFGLILSLITSEPVREWLGVPKSETGVWEAELATFAWATSMAVLWATWMIAGEVWLPSATVQKRKVL
ncbi:hypothetical protein MRB53_041935 [Persea americana]|nr:hypothetical protein MRB53_041935 [Persea americana]